MCPLDKFLSPACSSMASEASSAVDATLEGVSYTRVFSTPFKVCPAAETSSAVCLTLLLSLWSLFPLQLLPSSPLFFTGKAKTRSSVVGDEHSDPVKMYDILLLTPALNPTFLKCACAQILRPISE